MLALGWSDGLASWASSETQENESLTQTVFKRTISGVWHPDAGHPTVRELPVADVLQVGPGVFAHVLRGGDGTLLQLHLSPVDLGTLPWRDAAGHRASHG